MRRGLAAEKARFEGAVRSATSDKKRTSARLDGINAIAGKVPDLSGENFRMTVLGSEYDDRKEAGQALINEAQIRISDDRTGAKKVGQVGDFDLKMDVQKVMGEYSFDVIVDLDKVEYTTGETFDPVGLSRRIVGAMGRVSTDRDRFKRDIDKFDGEIKEYSDGLKGLGEFQHQARADELTQQIDDLEAELRAENAPKQVTKDQALPSGAKEWVRTLSNWASGKIKSATDLAIGKDFTVISTVVRRRLGFRPPNRIIVEAFRLNSIVTRHKSDNSAIRIGDLATLPALLSNPEFILKGSRNAPDNLVTVGLKNENGEPLIVVLNPNAKDRYGKPVMKVVSIYRKENYPDWINANLKNDNILYDRDGVYAGGRANSSGSNSVRRRYESDLTSARRHDLLTKRDIFKSKDQIAFRPSDAQVAFFDAIRTELDRLMLKKVRLSIDPDLAAQGQFKADDLGNMQILIGATENPIATARHEAIHALRNMGLFTDGEWAALERMADRRWMAEFDIAARYPDLSRSEMLEEAIAEAFAFSKPKDAGPITTAFAKIRRFFRAMAAALKVAPRESVVAIFEAVDTGEVGSRRRQSIFAAEKQQRARSLRGTRTGTHLPDRHITDALDEGQDFWDRVRAGKGGVHDAIDRARVKLQDKMLPTLRAEQAIEEALGHKVNEEARVYSHEELFSGRSGFKIDFIDDDYTKEIANLITGSVELTADVAAEYLYARHAPERNQRIADINPDMQDGGSGMTNEEARDILRKGHSRPDADRLRKIGRLIDQLREWGIKERLEHGLITKAEADAWRGTYKHYVPLKGWAETENSDAELDITGVGRGFSTRGPESMRAMGRRSEAFSPLISALTQAKEVAIRSEKNRVGQAMYQLAKDHPSKNLATVKKVEMIRYFNRSTGLVEVMPASPITLKQAENEMAVKVEGKEYRVVFHDMRLARAMTSVGVDQFQTIVRTVGWVSRVFSSVNTMLSPVFVVRNAFRDFITANITIYGLTDDRSQKIINAARRSYFKALVGALGGLRGKDDTEWQKHFEEFSRSGGKVSFWKMDDPAAFRASFEKQLKVSKSSGLRNTMRIFDAGGINTRDNPVFRMVENINLAVDNALRLAVFVEGRKEGHTEMEAASLSKNLTVNFNRRGELGPLLNALFPFYNAAIQGTATLLRVSTARRVAYTMAGMVIYGIMSDLINAAMSEEDEDGQLAYDKIPEYVSRMNLVFMTGGDGARVPMPFGFNVFPYMGVQIGKMIRGKKDIGGVAGDVAASFVDAYVPIGGGDFISLITPTFLDPAVEISRNKNWLGRPIRPESPWSDFGPDSQNYFSSVSYLSKQAAEFANWVTGGNKFEAGMIDISPEYMDHLFGFTTGGMGRFAGQMFDLGQKIFTGEKTTSFDWPFLREVSVTTGVWLDRNNYYTRREAIREAIDSAKGYQGVAQKPPERIQRLVRPQGALKQSEKTLREQRKFRRANPDMDRARRDVMERQEQLAYDVLNRAYVWAMGIGGRGF